MTLSRVKHLIFVLAYIVFAKLLVTYIENTQHIFFSSHFKPIVQAIIYILFGCIIGFNHARKMRFSWARLGPFVFLLILFLLLFFPYIGIGSYLFGFHKTVYLFVFSQNLIAWYLFCVAVGFYFISMFGDYR